MEVLGSDGDDEPLPSSLQLYSDFKMIPAKVRQRVAAQPSKSEISWKALAGKLHRLRRLGIFDVRNAPAVDYAGMLTPGRVSVIDLSDTDSPQLNNLVIADILRGLQDAQEVRYQKAASEGTPVVPTLIIIEEAHEFLSANRIAQMPVLFQQVARIAKRGRKRWLGLVFVTQLPHDGAARGPPRYVACCEASLRSPARKVAANNGGLEEAFFVCSEPPEDCGALQRKKSLGSYVRKHPA